MNTIKKVAVVLVIFLAAASLSAQDAVTKAITSANAHLLVREYDKAYPYASFVIRYFSGKDMTPDALDMCERVVGAYSLDLRQKEKYEELVSLEQSISAAPATVRSKAADNIGFAKKKIDEKKIADQKAEEERKVVEAAQRQQNEINEALKLEKQKEADREAERDAERKAFEEKEAKLKAERDTLATKQQAELDRIMKENRDAEAAKEKDRTQERISSQNLQVELERQRLDSESKYRDQLSDIIEMNNKSGAQVYASVSRTSTAVVVGLGVLGFIVLAGISLVVFLNLKQQSIQHEQFQNTISAMTSLRNAQEMSSMALPFMAQAVQALPGAAQQLLEQKPGVPSNQKSPNSVMNTPDELKVLYEKCMTYAEQIDEVTNRKNASKRVAELVYKISKALGYSEHDALLFYTVGLVYDIGFLNIDPVVLRSEHISEDQFELIKTHTTIGTNMVFFIEEKNRQLFKEGVSMHHENLDGTGYPKGLKDHDIPYIARVVRIAETYIALVSNRDYKEIKDRDSAIRELLSHENHYDLSIVKVLDGIV